MQNVWPLSRPSEARSSMIYGASQHRAAYASRTFAYRFELGVAGGLGARSRIEADRAEEVVGT